ncbi:cell surface protein SprA [Flavobacterium sp. RHBU_3]|uniref:T9SS outer membrane translocon Sov/SprA n=1 Tax=Flavobacterium sp. RHBU_3 TaxID=3391184 RepID=UPI00398505A7
MKTDYPKDLYKQLRYAFFVLFLLVGGAVQAQVVVPEEEENEAAQDTIKGYNAGKVELKNPSSISEAYTYDALTDRYILNTSFAGFNITYPLMLTREQYEELVLRESMREYYQQKSKALDDKSTDQQKKDLLPRYYVKSGLFESIFGGNTIDVKPQGYVEIDLGGRYTKQDNPALSPRNRRSFTFDFDQRISMSLQGKVGTRLNVMANYDTQSTFAFQNMIKLDYTPTEDDIIRKIEVGNISFPLSNSLIRGAQSLFGVKTQLQFGKTTITGIYSEQKSQSKTVTAQGGSTVQDFSIFALEYDQNKHFFLSQLFRNRYDQWIKDYPLVGTQVKITRIEVWVTNKQNRINTTENNTRNVLALQDLGEWRLTKQSPTTGVPNGADITTQAVGFVRNGEPAGFFNSSYFYSSDADDVILTSRPYPDNSANKLDPEKIGTAEGWLDSSMRQIVTTSPSGFTGGLAGQASEGRDYVKLENARKLTSSEYTLNEKLGYISLNTALNNDEVLAVAYQYTVGDKVFQVGEFGTDGVDATSTTTDSSTGTTTSVSTNSLILKMLKSSLINVSEPAWDLMMKNIYQLPNAYQLSSEDFILNILYTDPSPLNYITPAGESLPSGVADTPLLNVFNMDRLTPAGDPQDGGDGFFDFQQGYTIDATNGRVIFTSAEPFGEYLYDKLGTANNSLGQYNVESSYSPNQAKYVYRKLYQSTQAEASQQSSKNKFQLKGRFKSSGSSGEISLGAFNVPQGSVTVTAGGRTLVEGIDYTVNYQAGTVQLLDASLQNSNTPVQVSLENNNTFGQQTRRYFGVNVEHKFSDKFLLGATYLRMSERPYTSKSNYGQESVNNTIFGFNGNYSTEVPFFTRLVNKLPFVDTDVPSNFSFRGEWAYLKPDASKADQMNGEPTSYVEDFEGSSTTVDMRSASGWSLASVPHGFGGELTPGTLNSGFKRGKLAWYSIDPIFYASASRPDGINAGSVSSNKTRRIYYSELYPDTDVVPGQTNVVTTLDLSYFPQERGPYNFSPDADGNGMFTESRATENWAGIMRSLTSTNFEQTNVEYIQFWMLDPYIGNTGDAADADNVGTLEIHLGEISEDILSDNYKQYENGLPGTSTTTLVYTSVWGEVPASQSLIYAFDTDTSNRTLQDVGLDGLNDNEEATKFPDFAGFADPAADNYQYYLSVSGGIIDRYKNYNGLEGNSPVDVSNTSRGSTTYPDTEDINKDNTMNTIDAYYKYEIPVGPNAIPGVGYVVDARYNASQAMEQGTTPRRWLLYKIPVKNMTDSVNSLNSLRSIRFMRMAVSGFRRDITLRFAALDLVRSDWRRYEDPLDTDTDNAVDDDTWHTGFDVVSLNIQENANRSPINYVSPPGIAREQLYSNNAVINQNEQALSLRVYATNGGTDVNSGLEPGDARAVYKNVNVDMRQYKKVRMFLHAEALPNAAGNGPETNGLQDDQLAAILRFGTDFTDNFYQVEKPLKVTAYGSNSNLDAEDVWLEDNEIMVTLAALTKLKLMALQGSITVSSDGIYRAAAIDLDSNLAEGMILGIKGNPNFGYVRTLMLGLRNNVLNLEAVPTPAPAVRGEVWFNELRLSDMDNSGGWAAVGSMDTNFADIATVSAAGNISTIGFGTVEQGPTERSLEETKQYTVVTNVNVGKMLPKKWYLNLPFNYSVGETTITPKYDQYYQDITIDQALSVATSQAEEDAILNRNVDYTKNKSINFIGVKKERAPEQKPHVYDPENITVSYSYNQSNHHDYQIEDRLDQQIRATADYNFAFQSKPVEPLKNNAFMKKSQYWKLLSDFNFNYLPTNISFSTNIIRQYNMQKYRNVDVEGIAISPLYRRNYFFNYQYGFNYNITKSIKFNYQVATSNIVRNYLDEAGNAVDSYNVFDGFWDTGTANTHVQNFVLNYDLPLNKLPFLSFVKSTYSYNATYNWTRSTDALRYVTDENGDEWDLGNTIQNNNSHKLNTTFSMDMFYKYLGVGAKKKAPAKMAPPKAAPKPGEKIAAAPKVQQDGNVFVDGLIGLATMVKTVQANYTETNGTVLPGYLPSIGFLGTTKPTIGFILGSQDSDVRYEAAKLGYLTSYPEYNQSYSQVNTKDLNLTANVVPFPDFTIDLTAARTTSRTYSEQYDGYQEATISNTGEIIPGYSRYEGLSPNVYGNFQINTILIKTAFSRSDENGSEAFDQFRENRLTIANRLAEQYYGTTTIPRYGDGNPTTPTGDFADANVGYPVGYGKNNQAVLIPAFIAAYQGKDAGKSDTGLFRDIPLPAWVVKYTGLMRYKYFKERFKRFSIQHGYRASYNINSYRTNYDYSDTANGQDNNGVGNFYNKYVISNINLTEQFNPLIRFDVEMKSSLKIVAEMKKDRTLNMSFDNNLLTEVQGHDYTFGLGYRIKDVIITSKLANNPTNTIKSDLNLKADLTLRNSVTIIRYLDYDNNQLGGGQNTWNLKLTADYAFSKALTAIFYYDHSFSKAVISTSYPVTTIRTGFTLRYTFGN